MKNTKLILIEGIPGSGKSTTAQYISSKLRHKGYLHKWWYEEEQGHPIYVFDNYDKLKVIVDDLSDGNYKKIIEMALKRWEEFVESVKRSPEIIIVDSSLFGYLTWSLFPYEVPKNEIIQYVKDVERIIKPLNPFLIYFYQEDIGAALKQICNRRGGETEKNFVRNTTESPYGKTKGLKGFEGMVTYWRDYRKITDEMFQGLSFPKVSIDNSRGNWTHYYQEISEFLGFNQAEQTEMSQQDYSHLLGTYIAESDGITECSIEIESGHLIVDGLPQVWKKSQLITQTENRFEVQSLPFIVSFREGDGIEMRMTGPTLLDGSVDYIFNKKLQ